MISLTVLQDNFTATNPTARSSITYLRDVSGVKVINRGFYTANNKWQDVEGKAFFVNSETGDI